MKIGSWKFDKDVAKRFDAIAATNLPHYDEVIRKCVVLAEAAFPNKKKTRIIDVGSALGRTMEEFLKAGYTQVYGVDYSEAMLAKSRVRKNLILSATFPTDHGPFDLVVANWTLHFITDENKRKEYLRDIRESLFSTGMLILSEKMGSTPLVHDRYTEFKQSKGISDKAIAENTAAVKGVLVSYPLSWYVRTLEECGFKTVEALDAEWCFNTFLCRP